MKTEEISVLNYTQSCMYPKVVNAVASLLLEQKEIATVEVLMKLGNLNKKDYDLWRQGKVAYLENVFQGSLSKANRLLKIINFHMHDLKMIKRNVHYKQLNSKKMLQFSKTNAKNIEEVYSRHFILNQREEVRKYLVEGIQIK